MTTATPLPNAIAAATRCAVLADLALRRAPLHPAGPVLETIADCLYGAGAAFQEDVPTVIEGVVITNLMPADAWVALYDAEQLAADHPTTGFPATFGQYVTQPVYGAPLDLPDPLNPRSAELADQETRLRTGLEAMHALLTPDADKETVTLALESAFLLRSKLGKLADAVRVDHVRPELAPAPRAAADPEPLDLSGLTAYTVGIIRLAESKGLRPHWGQPRGNVRRIVLNAVGPHAAFGSIQIGKTSGKVLRAEIIPGNEGAAIRPKGSNGVRAALKDLPAAVCPDGCDARSAAVCARTDRP